ncbi:MAG TPA: DUF4349 domain-containing protein [Actinomycetota bacterium]|nr:DUF4349 domain-containing protein [Actinomycetota bacterium]
MTELELEIRSALAEEAAGYTVPDDLKGRTMVAARVRPGKPHRLVHGRGWVYALAAAGALTVLVALGTLVNPAPSQPNRTAAQHIVRAPSNVSNINGPLTSIDTSLGPVPAQAPSPGKSSGAGFQQSIVRTASVSVRVPKGHFASAWSQAAGVAGRFGGLVSNSNTQTANGRLASGNLTLQVPSTNLDQALAALGDLGAVSNQSTTSLDESGQVASDAAQLTALQGEEAEYLQLLPQAKSTADILAIEQPLNNVTQQIQTLQASQSYLQNQVAMASIQATLAEPGTQPAAARPGGRLATAWHQARNGVATVLAGFIVAVGYLLAPVVLVVLAWAAVRRLRRRVA